MSSPDGIGRIVPAVRCHAPGDLRIDSVAVAPPGPGEVAIAPLAVGVCGTDSHIVHGTFPAALPVTLGHEVCGRVVAVGPGVTVPAVDDLVTVEPHDYCTECAYCRLGQEHLCDSKRGYGVRLDGGMTEHMIVPARIAYVLPPDLPPWLGALTEPLACCVHGMDQLDPRSGLPLLIYGAGPAGAIMVALAKARGSTPIVVADPQPDRRALALRMGADVALDPSEISGEFPYVIDAVGSAAILESAIAVSSRGARILVFGVARPDDVASVRPNEIFARELTIVGAVINPYTHHRAANLLRPLGLDRFRPAFYPLEKVTDALEAQRTGTADKVFLAPFGEAAALG